MQVPAFRGRDNREAGESGYPRWGTGLPDSGRSLLMDGMVAGASGGVNDIPNLTKATLDDGTVGYFFGDTTIRAWETMENGKYRLKPVAGDQIACGEWYDLDLDQVARYCSLIEMYLNGKEEA